MIAGANTDLFGRRWFLVGGNLVCFVGHIIVGTAKSTNQIIAGMALTGLGAGTCQMAAFALTELLPNKWRHIGVVLADLAVYITVVIIPITARYGYFVGNWRTNFYAAAGLQAASFVGLLLLYFSPAHPLGLPYAQAFAELDYIGIFLFIAGFLPILMDIIWASSFPSTDAHVVVPLVIGSVVMVGFALWKTYGNAKHPLTPNNIFTSSRGREFTAPCIALAIINMFYYSSSIIWPTMVTVFYADPKDWKRAAALSLPQGLAITLGVLLSIFGSKIRNWQWQQAAAVTIMVIFGSLLGLGNPGNQNMMIAFLIISQVGYGRAIYLCIAITQMVAQAVYLAISTSTVTKWTAKLVPVAALGAGVTADQITSLMGLVGTANFTTTYDASVVTAVNGAIQKANERGIQGIAYTSLAFGIVGIIACLFCKDVDAKMTNKIEMYIENSKMAERNSHH
ncbi:fungal trichothecene efflux pump-domain-containing protein [Calycina marina]|uniref:Fungal trichothecene efflux pump-domain-containing protein n=1 Tax=Calycina marina TaxID=1763456 RepID=A0A9P7YWI6_9HELO|nr:fungal trichothecene efflux pump-domain-containing protein [Calycina marina]